MWGTRPKHFVHQGPLFADRREQSRTRQSERLKVRTLRSCRFQKLRVVCDVGLDEGGDEEVRVIVSGLHVQLQRDSLGVTSFLEVLGEELTATGHSQR
jgi:hypothetical protein